MTELSKAAAGRSAGAILHAATAYDALVWLATLGRDQAFRDTILRFARLRAGDRVLDAGCGTGSLAIAARRQVGPAGAVCGVDASPEMITRAQHKAQACGLDVDFAEAAAQALPYPEQHFDVVLSTLMLHHLPRPARQDFAREARRVLKPGGRLLIVDFVAEARAGKGLFAHFHGHGDVELGEIVSLLEAAGLRIVDSGPLGFRGAVGVSGLRYVLATVEGT